MNKLFGLICEQIKMIEKLNGREVLINDLYSFLSKTELSSLKAYNRYHFNPYCLFAKGNEQINKHCQRFKRRLVIKSGNQKEVIKSVCFCGVVEYMIPIFVNEVLLGTVSVAGFKGKMLPRQMNRLSKRLNVSFENFEKIHSELLVEPYDEQQLMHEIKLLAYLIENYVKKAKGVSDFLVKKNQLSNTYVINALDYIERNFYKDISVIDVAKASFISASYLQSLFSKLVGHGVAEEIRFQRIKYAKELLCTTEYSIKQIAFECGFESSEYFSYVFKNECDIPPLKFRKSNKHNPS